jgi:hypothetical protein
MVLAIRAILCLILLGFGPLVFGQGGRADAVPSGSKVNPNDPRTRALNARQRFAYDVVRSAVALPLSEAQDRLRVLAAAATVITPIRPAMAKKYSREGLRLEQELIQRGEQPATSMLRSGPVDCAAVQTLVENIPAQRVDAAEPTLVAAIAACPAVSASAERLIGAGMQERKLAPRATLALMEHAGMKSAWSQDRFEQIFDSLPADAGKMEHEAPNLAALYSRAAGEVDEAAAKNAGMSLLLWLGKLDAGGDRTIAVNVTAGAMKQALGSKDYEDALASDMMARQVAQSAGGEGEISRPDDGAVSVLKAMESAQVDRLQDLQALPPAQRAREAAARGFASGSAGESGLSSRYFDLAFSSLNAVWSDREAERNAPAVVGEVSEAAAQVDSIDALKRTRELNDPAAQAIGMIAVARVVASDEEKLSPTSASR